MEKKNRFYLCVVCTLFYAHSQQLFRSLRRRMDMVIFYLLGFCSILFLVLIGYLRMKNWDSASRMINADWLDPSEKFHLIARWGA